MLKSTRVNDLNGRFSRMLSQRGIRRTRLLVKPVRPLEIRKGLTSLPLAICGTLKSLEPTSSMAHMFVTFASVKRLQRLAKLQASTMAYQKLLAAFKKDDPPDLSPTPYSPARTRHLLPQQTHQQLQKHLHDWQKESRTRRSDRVAATINHLSDIDLEAVSSEQWSIVILLG
jgi:hypothetical protein